MTKELGRVASGVLFFVVVDGFFCLNDCFSSDHCKQAMMLLAGTEDDFLVFREKTISTFFVLESGKKCCVRRVSF